MTHPSNHGFNRAPLHVHDAIGDEPTGIPREGLTPSSQRMRELHTYLKCSYYLPLVLARPPAFGEWRLAAMPTRLYPIAESSGGRGLAVGLTRSVVARVVGNEGRARGQTERGGKAEPGDVGQSAEPTKCHECMRSTGHCGQPPPQVIIVT